MGEMEYNNPLKLGYDECMMIYGVDVVDEKEKMQEELFDHLLLCSRMQLCIFLSDLEKGKRPWMCKERLAMIMGGSFTVVGHE